jgi:hypothetical protein
MLDPGNIDRDSLSPILEEMGRAQAGTRFNVFRRFREAVLQRSEARQILIDYWMGTRIQAWVIATVGSLWKMSSTVKTKSRKSAWALTSRHPYLGYVGYKL